MHYTEEKVLSYITDNGLLDNGQLIIVGVSGGADSIALLSILNRNGYKCIAAHCNFHLRDAESDRDMNFVLGFCEKYGITLEITHFDTNKYASENHLSIEMAARELRYEWFSALMKKHRANALAIAHHSDDVIETFFINMLRGAGLHGLTGIKARNGNIIRPLLCVSRMDIIDYISFIGESYVTDSSNNENDYLRNKIRNIIIPELETASPSAKKTILKTINHLKASEEFQNTNIKYWKEKCMTMIGSIIRVDLTPITNKDDVNLILYELLRPYNATELIVKSIMNAGSLSSGQEYVTNGYRIVKNRQFLDIENTCIRKHENWVLNKDDVFSSENFPLKMEIEYKSKQTLSITRSKEHCYLDLDKLVFPLKIRHWKDGDYFVPFGMKNQKKLSDFFINEKMSVVEKDNCFILENGNGDILWIVGIRADNRYRVTDRTNMVAHLNI